MGWLIAALGTGLAAGGTIAIYSGAPYIQVEWGYSEVIAGTTALSAGILAVALAAILFALRDLQRLAIPGGPAIAARAAAPAGGMAQGRSDASLSPVPSGVAAPPPVSRPAEARALHRDEEPALFRPAEAERPPSAEQAPTVVGRYEANGASYVLFSDGTIEVETETGTHRYASMQELRSHIEQGDG